MSPRDRVRARAVSADAGVVWPYGSMCHGRAFVLVSRVATPPGPGLLARSACLQCPTVMHPPRLVTVRYARISPVVIVVGRGDGWMDGWMHGSSPILIRFCLIDALRSVSCWSSSMQLALSQLVSSESLREIVSAAGRDHACDSESSSDARRAYERAGMVTRAGHLLDRSRCATDSTE
jgi:hypothetical protein